MVTNSFLKPRTGLPVKIDVMHVLSAGLSKIMCLCSQRSQHSGRPRESHP